MPRAKPWNQTRSVWSEKGAFLVLTLDDYTYVTLDMKNKQATLDLSLCRAPFPSRVLHALSLPCVVS